MKKHQIPAMKKVFFRNYLFISVLALLIIAFLFLLSTTNEKLKQFEQYHQDMSKHTSLSTASEIELLLENLKLGLTILVKENPRLIANLAADPENEELLSQIHKKMGNYFSSFHAVTVTNQYGELLIDDFGEKIGEFCRADIIKVIKDDPGYGISVHPAPDNYHFDIMVPWQINDTQYDIQKGIFFVSFSLVTLIDSLKNNKIINHALYILHQTKKNLIELSVQGGRDVLDGDNFFDNNTEGHIIHKNKINGALWEVVDILPKEMIQKHRNALLKNNINIFLGLLLFTIFMLYMVFKEEKKRKVAEYNVLDINKNLEQLITEKTIDLQKFYSAIEQAKDATIITNNKGVIEYVNDAFTQVTGFAREELIGRTSNHLKSGKHDEQFYKNMWQILLAGEPFHSIFINRRKNGDLYHEDKTITPIKDNDGHIIYFIGTGKDVSERIKYEEELSYLAHHDVLTGLPNRVLLHDRIDHSIAMAIRSKQKLAIMFLDLNRFKAVNDRLGHAVGDKLLKQVSDRLTSMLRESDTVCRNGGDEFIILMECISHDEEILMLVNNIVNEISQSFLIDKQEVNIGVSIGIAIYPDNGTSHMELIKNADTAMYQAKEAKTSGYQFYANNMSTEMMERLEIEAQLHSALENKEFYLVYQPKVDLYSGETVGFEALLRWHSPEFGFVSPAKFIPILESFGLINEVGLWTLHEVVEQIKKKCFKDLMISINLSPLQFRNPHFFEEIKIEFQNNQISPSQIEFEVTESLMMDNFESSKEKLQQLHHLGCSIALDDFGTGHSSLSYLTQLPIDVLKVDRSFITNIDQYPQQQAMLESILFMTKKFNVTTIIEGVETDEELNEIKQLGGSIIQGYYFSKPLKHNEISNWLQVKETA